MRKFKCDSCNVEFISDRTDEEAQEESEKMWGKIEEQAIICHDCYTLLLKRLGRTEDDTLQ